MDADTVQVWHPEARLLRLYEVLMSVGVLPRAHEVQDLLDSASAALDAAAGIVWPERVYRACNRLWVYRVVEGFRMFVPVEKIRAPVA